MFYVYILRSKTKNWKYVGFCSNLKKRYNQHNSGEVQSTSAYKPFELIYYECFTNELDAVAEEKFLKTGKGRERLKYLLKNT